MDFTNQRASQVAARRQSRYPLKRNRPRRSLSLIYLVLFMGAAIGYGALTLTLAGDASRQYDSIDASIAKNLVPLTKTVQLKSGSPGIVVANKDPFRASGVWAYTASSELLPDNYQPPLQTVKVPTSRDTAPARMQPMAGTSLVALFTAARNAGHPLVAVSAYRSITDQKELYNSYVQTQGVEQANAYVALPGASEHHTGLAVDVDDYSEACVASSASCGISPATAEWVAKHAPDYGFIIRYPEGKEKVTGINYEPWHLRYVGPQAKVLTQSGLTLDELVARERKRKL